MSTEITPGGTITLARGAATVKGIVTQYAADSIYSRRAGEARSIVPAVNIEDLGPFPLGGPGGMEVVDYQPAPEPEPVWEPGTVGTAAVKGRFGRVRVMRLHECPTDKTHHWVEESGLIPDDSHVTDVRPLVVIDPAAVDAFDLASRAVANLRDKGRTPDIDDAQTYIREALAELGLDGAS